MTVLTRISVVLFCLILAIVCYGLSFQAGGIAFIIVGALFEGLAWFGIFSNKKKT